MKAILILLSILLLAGAAYAENKTCKTRRPAIETRFQQLCPLVRAVHPRPTPWNETKCATWLFERGMADFRERTRTTQLNAANRQTRLDIKAEREDEFSDVTPAPTASPTVSPTTSPTPSPTPQ